MTSQEGTSLPGSAARLPGAGLVRLGAASAVLVSHAFTRLRPVGEDPLAGLTGGIGLGRFAVLIFFVVSGYTVALSWRRQPTLGVFLAKRALRILPGLCVSLCVAALIVAPFLVPDVAGYLASRGPWSYVVHNSLLDVQTAIPGVSLRGNPSDNLNTSIWTLPYEASCYAAIGVVGVLTVRARNAAVLTTLCSVILLLAVYGGTLRIPTLDGATLFEFGAYFAAGAVLSTRQLRAKSWWAVALLALWCVTWRTPLMPMVGALAIPVAVIAVASIRMPGYRFTERTDLSYGVYLYHPMVLQTVMYAWPDITSVQLLAVAAIPTFGLAALSWRLVESPALRLKPAGGVRATQMDIGKCSPAASLAMATPQLLKRTSGSVVSE